MEGDQAQLCADGLHMCLLRWFLSPHSLTTLSALVSMYITSSLPCLTDSVVSNLSDCRANIETGWATAGRLNSSRLIIYSTPSYSRLCVVFTARV